jgi:hypothetical protein
MMDALQDNGTTTTTTTTTTVNMATNLKLIYRDSEPIHAFCVNGVCLHEHRIHSMNVFDIDIMYG